MKKTILTWCMIFCLLLSGTTVFADVSAPAAGLLRGHVNDQGAPQPKWTDGNIASYGILNGGDYVWTFERQVHLSGLYLYADSADAQLHMQDANGTVLASIGASTTAPTVPFQVEVSGVKSVRLSSADPGRVIRVYELDVYGAPEPVIPQAPTGVAGTSTQQSIDLVWNKEPDATYYEVKRSYTTGGPYTVMDSVYANHFEDKTVAQGSTYYYVIAAGNEHGVSPNSQEVAVVAKQKPPAAPSNLYATPSEYGIDLYWSTVNEATYYTVKRSYSYNGPYETVTNTVYGTYHDYYASSGQTYYYYVTATNSGGQSAPSQIVSATRYVRQPDRAIVFIELTNGARKEYDMWIWEAQSFEQWYQNPYQPSYTFNKSNLGPFANRKESIAHTAIASYEINNYISR